MRPADKLLSPVVRRLLTEHDLDPPQITGTGAGGRITRNDVLDTSIKHVGDGGAAPAAAAAAGTGRSPLHRHRRTAAPAPAAAPGPRPSRPRPHRGQRDEAVTLPNIRKRTAEHMVDVEADVAARVQRRRGRLRERSTRCATRTCDAWKAEEGFSLTYLPFVSRAVIDAIAEFPRCNATVGDDELIVHHYVDLGIAVDLDFKGLLVPVIHDADAKRIRAIAREI